MERGERTTRYPHLTRRSNPCYLDLSFIDFTIIVCYQPISEELSRVRILIRPFLAATRWASSLIIFEGWPKKNVHFSSSQTSSVCNPCTTFHCTVYSLYFVQFSFLSASVSINNHKAFANNSFIEAMLTLAERKLN